MYEICFHCHLLSFSWFRMNYDQGGKKGKMDFVKSRVYCTAKWKWDSSISSSIKPKVDIGLFVDFCVFSCFYQFLHDVIIILFCRSKQNNFMITLSWVINGWWHRFGLRLFYRKIKTKISLKSDSPNILVVRIPWMSYYSIFRIEIIVYNYIYTCDRQDTYHF